MNGSENNLTKQVSIVDYNKITPDSFVEGCLRDDGDVYLAIPTQSEQSSRFATNTSEVSFGEIISKK